MKDRAPKLSRRDFLKVAGASAVSLLLASLRGSLPSEVFSHQDMGVEFDKNDGKLSFSEAAQLDRKIGNVYKELNLENWKPNFTPEFIKGWVEEAADQIEAEGIATRVELPSSFDVFHPSDGSSANHTLGYTDCQTLVRINSRFLNPTTPLYNNPYLLGTIVHELVHFEAQGSAACHAFPTELVEATAQIGMLETLAAMATRGNKIAFKAFVVEAYSMIDGALLALAENENRVAEYEQIRESIQPGAFDLAREEKMFREWADEKAQFEDLVDKYYLFPMSMMYEAHFTNKDFVEDVALPDIITSYGGPPSRTPAWIEIDDWAYVMNHLEDMAKEISIS